MTEDDLLVWFRDLDRRSSLVPRDSDGFYLDRDAGAWLVEAESALGAVFPSGHACRSQWRQIFDAIDRQRIGLRNHSALEAAAGAFRAALSLLESGRVRSLLDGIRAETVSEVLDQAIVLVSASHGVAAAVLAGGALETHLLHLCQRNGLTWAGDGSIGKYDGAIAQARNAGTLEVYGITDSKLIGGWGGLRNDAAHSPTTFARAPSEVRQMIEGIRQFIARVP